MITLQQEVGFTYSMFSWQLYCDKCSPFKNTLSLTVLVVPNQFLYSVVCTKITIPLQFCNSWREIHFLKTCKRDSSNTRGASTVYHISELGCCGSQYYCKWVWGGEIPPSKCRGRNFPFILKMRNSYFNILQLFVDKAKSYTFFALVVNLVNFVRTLLAALLSSPSPETSAL